MGWADWITAISAMIAATAVACTAYFAKQGMSVWRQQMKGKDEYTLARDLLVSIYTHRDAMHDVRRSLMTIVDRPPYDEAKHMNSKQIQFYGKCRAYSSRWKEVSKQHRKIYRDMVVAQVIWGNELTKLLESLLEQEQELRVTVEEYLDLISPENETSRGENAHQELRELRPVLYGRPEDEFGQKIENGIKPAEQYLKQKLSEPSNS